MSLLDNVINAATSALGGNGEQNQAVQLVSQLVQQNGGNVGELLGKLQQGGLGDALQSWIGTGSNASVDASQIQNALGSNLTEAAAKVGLDASSASNLLAQYLPNIINAITPNGNAADAAAELARQSGIAKASAARLLAMSLPLVLAHLGRSSGSLPDFLKLLAGQSDHLAKNLNGGLLSALGISNVAAVSAVAHKLSEHAASLQLSDDGLPAVSGKSSIAGNLPVLLLAAVLAVVAFKGCSTKVVEQGQDRPFEADVVQPHPAVDQSLPALPLPDEAVTTPNGPGGATASRSGGG